jgi:general secretion pathway protein L
VTEALLLFLGRHGGIDGWLRLEDGAVVARGPGDALPPTGAGETVAAVVPGDAVTLHWIELPAGLAPAQAAAAARLMAAEFSAEALPQMHVAVGREVEAGLRCVALASVPAMAEWLGRLQAAGVDPDLMLPEPLLLQPPEEGVRRYDRAGLSLYRGPTEALAMEPATAGLILAGREPATIDRNAFEGGLAEAVARPLVDLRQGAFARRRQWKMDARLVRRLALLGVAILFVTLAIQFAAILRYTFAADALEAEARRAAAAALPRNAGVTDASAELGERLSELRGGGVGFSAIAAALFGAVRETANAEVSAIVFNPDGSLRATVQADAPATLAALGERIEAEGFAVRSGALRSGGGRQVADLTMRPR